MGGCHLLSETDGWPATCAICSNEGPVIHDHILIDEHEKVCFLAILSDYYQIPFQLSYLIIKGRQNIRNVDISGISFVLNKIIIQLETHPNS